VMVAAWEYSRKRSGSVTGLWVLGSTACHNNRQQKRQHNHEVFASIHGQFPYPFLSDPKLFVCFHFIQTFIDKVIHYFYLQFIVSTALHWILVPPA
jgi:hypothetical protein